MIDTAMETTTSTTTSAEETMFRAKFHEEYYKRTGDVPDKRIVEVGWAAASFVIEEHKKRYDKLLDTFDSSVGRKK